VFKTIACSADGSPSARSALTVATELARTVSGRLVIIHVQEVRISPAGHLIEDSMATLASLQRAAQQLRHEGIDATVHSSTATARDTARTILDLARRTSADVLVVGNSAHGPVASLVLGGVAGRLLQRAQCPVILAPCHSTDDTFTADSNVAAGSVRA